VGDAITALGSFFGDAIWAVPSGDDAVDRVESHIALCTDDGGEVLLELHRGAAKRAAAERAEDPNLIENAAVRSTTDMCRESGHLLLFFRMLASGRVWKRGSWRLHLGVTMTANLHRCSVRVSFGSFFDRHLSTPLTHSPDPCDFFWQSRKMVYLPRPSGDLVWGGVECGRTSHVGVRLHPRILLGLRGALLHVVKWPSRVVYVYTVYSYLTELNL